MLCYDVLERSIIPRSPYIYMLVRFSLGKHELSNKLAHTSASLPGAALDANPDTSLTSSAYPRHRLPKVYSCYIIVFVFGREKGEIAVREIDFPPPPHSCPPTK